MMEKSKTRSKRDTKRRMPATFESLAIVLFIASCCQGVPVRGKNNINGSVGKWREISSKLRAGSSKKGRKLHTVDNNEDTADHIDDDVGDVSSQPQSFFSWEASIHGPTGVASSNERSGPFSLTTKKATPWPQLRRTESKDSDGDSHSVCLQDEEEQERKQRMMEEEERLIVETSRQFVNTWSDFLCRGSISFGILRCMKETNAKKRKRITIRRKQRQKADPTGGVAPTGKSRKIKSSSLMARFSAVPVKLLEFGKIVESSPSPSPSICDDGDEESENKGLVVLGSWDIPLQGGSLILEDDKSQKKRSKSSGRRKRGNRGKLTFAIAKTTRLPDEDQEDDDFESCRHGNSYQIITGITNYRPFLAGGGYTSKFEEGKTHDNIWDALKANRETTTRRLCHAFYLSTQSMVHAYVTWRFHHAWRQELENAVQKKENK